MRVSLFLAMLVVGCGVAIAQQPPIKMGLWEKSMTMTSAGKSNSFTSRSCVTPAYWQEMVGNINKQQPGCSIQTTKTAKGYSFSGTCQGGQVVLNGSSTITDAEHIVAESHSTSTRNGQKRETETRSTSKWISADCGNVKPGGEDND